ncbi:MULTISPECIES: DUF2207 domain-containing protein [unclassified Jeotgalibaca]|uniref:DUF2207 domain-containing protein n=1 Tax=unclassified Jeotgalibaca TaxID=2621505 RepID=UPI003FD5F589
MKKLMAIISFTFFLLFGLSPPEVAARSYEINNYDVQVNIQEDGSALFTERITYYFDGEFNGVLFNLDYSPHPTPTDVSVAIEEEGEAAVPYSQDTTQQPGTYEMTDTGTFLNFTVYNPITDDDMTVIYSYRIPEMVTNYNDVAQFNRKVIGSAWDDELLDVDIRIELPAAVEPGELKAWGHGDANGNVTLEEDRVVNLSLNRNPANTFVEANVIFPTYVTWNNPNTVNENNLDQIIANEEAIERAEEQRYWLLVIVGAVFGVIGPLLALAVLFWLRKKYKETNPVPYQEPDYVYELPEDMSPAVMNKAIFNQEPDSEAVSATILDLVRRGYLQMKEIPLEDGFDYELRKLKEPDSGLLKHEKQLMRWFLKIGGDGKAVTFGRIESINYDTKLGERFYKARMAWQQAVRDDAKVYEERYRAPHATTARTWSIITLIANNIFFILLTIGVFAYQLPIWLFLLGFTGLALAIYVLLYHVKHPAVTPEGDKAKKDWRAFERMLEDVGDFTMQDIGSVELWDTYLVYATAMGIAYHVLEQMAIQYPDDVIYGTSYFYPFYYHNPGYIDGVNDPIARGIDASTPQSDSSSGSGGGFSGGSSGGSGGGSGGGAF